MVSVKKRISFWQFWFPCSCGFLRAALVAPQKHTPGDTITLYGNVDIRQVQLAFNDSERIDKLLVDEGSAIHAGQLVAQLAQQRFLDAVAQDQATVAAQQQVVARLLAGSRPEEVAEARADVAAAQADVARAQANVTNAELLYRRQQTLSKQQYVSLQIRDDAQRSYLAEQADLAAKQQVLAAKEQVLRLAVIGPRKEDIAAAQATLKADTAALALAQKAAGRYTALCSRRGSHPEPDTGARRYGQSADACVYSRSGQSTLGACLSAGTGDGQSRSRHACVD